MSEQAVSNEEVSISISKSGAGDLFVFTITCKANLTDPQVSYILKQLAGQMDAEVANTQPQLPLSE